MNERLTVWENVTPDNNVTRSAREKTYHSAGVMGTTETLTVHSQLCSGVTERRFFPQRQERKRRDNRSVSVRV